MPQPRGMQQRRAPSILLAQLARTPQEALAWRTQAWNPALVLCNANAQRKEPGTVQGGTGLAHVGSSVARLSHKHCNSRQGGDVDHGAEEGLTHARCQVHWNLTLCPKDSEGSTVRHVTPSAPYRKATGPWVEHNCRQRSSGPQPLEPTPEGQQQEVRLNLHLGSEAGWAAGLC